MLRTHIATCNGYYVGLLLNDTLFLLYDHNHKAVMIRKYGRIPVEIVNPQEFIEGFRRYNNRPLTIAYPPSGPTPIRRNRLFVT